MPGVLSGHVMHVLEAKEMTETKTEEKEPEVKVIVCPPQPIPKSYTALPRGRLVMVPGSLHHYPGGYRRIGDTTNG